MNLGTLIGELRLKLAEAVERAPVVSEPNMAEPEDVAGPRKPMVTTLIRQALAAHPEGLTCSRIAEVTGLEPAVVGTRMFMMRDVTKTGERGSYVYALAKVAL